MKPKEQRSTQQLSRAGDLMFQGWLSVVFWIAFGLLLESLMAYKVTGYLGDQQRRELLRLAHAHGTLLSFLIILVSLCDRIKGFRLSTSALYALRIGVVVMPAGFLLAGLFHYESDPGLAIWLVPIGALLMIFGVINAALNCRNRDEDRRLKS